jgi:hypothetical protein
LPVVAANSAATERDLHLQLASRALLASTPLETASAIVGAPIDADCWPPPLAGRALRARISSLTL